MRLSLPRRRRLDGLLLIRDAYRAALWWVRSEAAGAVRGGQEDEEMSGAAGWSAAAAAERLVHTPGSSPLR